MIDNIFILAGGSGTRLWPASVKAVPKQFLEVTDGKSLLILTVERALALEPSGKIYIITLKDQMDSVISECMKLEKGADRIVIVPEPRPKNTAPAIAVAASYLRNSGEGESRVLVMPADHLVSPVDVFRKDVEKAAVLADKGFLVTFGIVPSYPATGYGYIESGDKTGPGFTVREFREKPDRKTAEEFIRQGGFYWNSGMFVFTADSFWKELEIHSSKIAETFRDAGKGEQMSEKNGISVILDNGKTEKIYASSPSDSIDYAVMEKSGNTAVVAASFTWNDIGSWDEMADIRESSGENAFSVESRNNFVYSDIPVALCGVEDLVVVQKNGALLICRKGKGQLVKDAVEEIKKRGMDHLL